MAASGVEAAFRMLEGRWKVVIIFHLFDQTMLRFSELERAILGVSQKMLIQQLRELERDSIVERTIYPQVPPKVEYRLTDWGLGNVPRPGLSARMGCGAPAGDQTQLTSLGSAHAQLRDVLVYGTGTLAFSARI